MARLAPLSLRLVDPAWVDRVPAPAHDSLSPGERRRYLIEHPDSYLTVTRSPDDLRPGERWDPDEAAAASRQALDRLLTAGAFTPETEPTFHLYRLSMPGHAQVGIVGAVSTADYDTGVLRVHEHVRPDRVAHLSSQTAVVGVQSSPIAVAHKPIEELQALVATIMDGADPILDFTAIDGVGQQVWPVDPAACATIIRLLAPEPLYLMDGHHRAAATSHLNRAGGPGADWMLAAIFAAPDLRNEAFHRLVPGADPDWLLTEVGRHFPVRPADDLDTVLGRQHDEIALLTRTASGQPRWHLVRLPAVADGFVATDREAASARILASLEPVRLEHHVLGPLIQAAATEGAAPLQVELSYGRADRQDLIQLQATADHPVWVMRPIPLETIMAVSDAGAIMPAKSTYFRPKVRSGVFLRQMG